MGGIISSVGNVECVATAEQVTDAYTCQYDVPCRGVCAGETPRRSDGHVRPARCCTPQKASTREQPLRWHGCLQRIHGLRAARRRDERSVGGRIDSVHEGDPEQAQNAHVINSMDCATQWVLAVCTWRMGKPHLWVVINAALNAYPFTRGFPSRYGRERTSHATRKLSYALCVEPTELRPLRRSDNEPFEPRPRWLFESLAPLAAIHNISQPRPFNCA